MSSLYELAEVLNELRTLSEENGGVYSEECLYDTWEALEGEFDAKTEAWCKAVKNIEADIDVLEAEADRLKNKARSMKRTEMLMKSNLAAIMLTAGKTKLKTPLFNINRLKLNGKLDVKAKDVPEEFRKEQVSRVPDNDKIREALDKGEKLPFARYYNSITIQ